MFLRKVNKVTVFYRTRKTELDRSLVGKFIMHGGSEVDFVGSITQTPKLAPFTD